MITTSVDEVDEKALLTRARQGDSDAFLQLIEPHHEAIRPIVYRIIDEPSLLDDTMQEIYMKAYRGLARFNGRSSFRTWLFRIAYNAAVDVARRRPRTVPLSDEKVQTAKYDNDDIDSRHDLVEAMRKLSPEARAAVWLVDAQGFDYESAAEVLRIPRGTLATRLSVARAALRNTLGDYTKEVDR